MWVCGLGRCMIWRIKQEKSIENLEQSSSMEAWVIVEDFCDVK